MKLSIKEIVGLILVIALSGIAIYYYFKFQGVRNDELDIKKSEEQERLRDIDSLKKDIKERDSDILYLINYSDSLKEVINQRRDYVPNNNDVDNANPTELEQLLSRYYD